MTRTTTLKTQWVSSPVVLKTSIGNILPMAKPSPSYSGAIELINLGKAIRQTRVSLGVSQEALADKAGLDRSYLGGIERGEHNIAIINLVKIAKSLEITTAELLFISKI